MNGLEEGVKKSRLASLKNTVSNKLRDPADNMNSKSQVTMTLKSDSSNVAHADKERSVECSSDRLHEVEGDGVQEPQNVSNGDGAAKNGKAAGRDETEGLGVGDQGDVGEEVESGGEEGGNTKDVNEDVTPFLVIGSVEGEGLVDVEVGRDGGHIYLFFVFSF